MKSNSGKHGFPVLAYLTSEPLSLSCTLRIQHHEPRKQVTLMLRTCVSLHGADEQAFVVQYDADNLTVGDATVYIPENRGAAVARNPSSGQMTTLSLKLSRACPLWCPRTEVLLPAPEPAQVEAFNELVQLAKATTVHIVFDLHWLSLVTKLPYQRLVKGKERLTAFPVHQYYSRFYRLVDWTAFGPPEVSNKRQRRVSSPLPSPPPYKRKAVEPEHAPSPTEVATSPVTVKSNNDDHDFQARTIASVVQCHLPAVLADLRAQIAITKQTPQIGGGECILCGCVEKHLPECIYGLSGEKAAETDEVMHEGGCVAELMKRCLPDLIAEQLPATFKHTLSHEAEEKDAKRPKGNLHDLRTRAIVSVMQLHLPAALAIALPAALKEALPNVLPEVLPPLLPALFALTPSFTSSYDSSSFDDGSPSPPTHSPNDYSLRPRDLTPLGAALLPHLLAHLQPQLKKMHARSMARGVHFWQKTAFFDLEETAEGYKSELSRLRDDGVEELQREARVALDGVREEAGGVAEVIEEEVCERVEDEIRRKGNAAVRDVRRAIQAATQLAEWQGGVEARRRGGRRVGKGGYRGVDHRGRPVA